ncbi:MAG: hypothetical protein IJS96_04535 [Schwartzia sp.]|nr:hypothetical protein [Schwartzia sp. (in: firmicutes)]
MAIKDTKQLENELREAGNMSQFLVENQENLRERTLADYLNEMLDKKKITKAEAVRRSGLEPVYAYHIFAGRKKNSSRLKALSLAIGLGLTPPETQYLLYYAGAGQLYVRNPWDSVLWFALEKHLTIEETNNLLTSLSLAPLPGRPEDE